MVAAGNLWAVCGRCGERQTEAKQNNNNNYEDDNNNNKNMAASPAAICSINPLWEERKGAQTAKRSRKSAHPQ